MFRFICCVLVCLLLVEGNAAARIPTTEAGAFVTPPAKITRCVIMRRRGLGTFGKCTKARGKDPLFGYNTELRLPLDVSGCVFEATSGGKYKSYCTDGVVQDSDPIVTKNYVGPPIGVSKCGLSREKGSEDIVAYCSKASRPGLATLPFGPEVVLELPIDAKSCTYNAEWNPQGKPIRCVRSK